MKKLILAAMALRVLTSAASAHKGPYGSHYHKNGKVCNRYFKTCK